MIRGVSNQQVEENEWLSLLETFVAQREKPIRAITFRKALRTKAEPVLVKCEDGREYFVKGQQAGRQIVNDQIVARIGQALGAPVGEPSIIDISRELIEVNPNLSHISPGTAHGTVFIPDCRDEWSLIATSEPSNRSRLILLALLYGWIFSNDQQFLFNKNPPRLIHSVDHGHFFPGGPDWSIEDLQKAPKASLDPYFADCNFTPTELAEAKVALVSVTNETIVRAVSIPPEAWRLTIEERLALIGYLTRRKQELLEGILP
jgi:hypothetical protein